MEKKDQLWAVFSQTGRVEDYLRYRQAVEMPSSKDAKETANGTDGNGIDPSGTQYR